MHFLKSTELSEMEKCTVLFIHRYTILSESHPLSQIWIFFWHSHIGFERFICMLVNMGVMVWKAHQLSGSDNNVNLL